jgi:hypothetical protein
MIASEHHYEDRAGGVVRELMKGSIDARKLEVRRGGTEREDGMRLLG